jgi:hypothetical protein
MTIPIPSSVRPDPLHLIEILFMTFSPTLFLLQPSYLPLSTLSNLITPPRLPQYTHMLTRPPRLPHTLPQPTLSSIPPLLLASSPSPHLITLYLTLLLSSYIWWRRAALWLSIILYIRSVEV